MPRLYGIKPELMTPDAVISFYNENGGGFYRIFLGDSSKNKIRFAGDNEETLLNALSIIEDNPENCNIYTLSLFDANGKKENLRSEINFCFNGDNSRVGGFSDTKKIEYYLKKLTDKDDEQNDDDDDQAHPVGSYWERMLPPEQMGLILQQIAGVLVQKFLPDNQPGIPGNIVAGVETEHIQILTDLMNKGVTIEHLRKLNAMSTIQLKTLLTML
jgi:hypothetical protein